jgi:RNA polymerase sigma factor (sigma-70 family)
MEPARGPVPDEEERMTQSEIGELVAGHRELLAFVERRVGDRAAAEDILQDALVRSLGRAQDLRDEDSAVAWMYRALRNAIVDHHRRGGASERALAELASELGGEAEPPPDARAAVCRCVGHLAETLKPEYAAVIRRVEVDGLAVHAFAAEAGITSNNASVRLHRAREALRVQVRAACGTCAEHGCVDCTCAAPPARGAP